MSWEGRCRFAGRHHRRTEMQISDGVRRDFTQTSTLLEKLTFKELKPKIVF